MSTNALHEIGATGDALYRAGRSLDRLLRELEYIGAPGAVVLDAREIAAETNALAARLDALRTRIEGRAA